MPYMLLIIEPTGQRSRRSADEGHDAYARMKRFGAELQAQGLLQSSEALASRASRVEVRDGRTQVLDGPFAEAKEMVGGFFLLSCESRAQAVEIAARCPAAEFATVEVRALGPCYD